MLAQWDARGYDATEKARSLIDLFFLSVLLDAGAGDVWKFYESESNTFYARSEGIAVASLHMFLDGKFAEPSSTRNDVVHGLNPLPSSRTFSPLLEAGSDDSLFFFFF